MSALTKALNIHFTKCVLFLTASRISECFPDRIFDDSSEESNEFIHFYSIAPSYRFTPRIHDKNQYKSTAGVWIIIVCVLAFAVFIVVCCVFFCILSRRRRLKRRQMQGIARQQVLNQISAPQSPSAPPIGILDDGQTVWNRSSGISQRSEPPPEYAAIVQEEPGQHQNHHVLEQNKAETPPPEYITVAPFQ